MSAAEAQEMVDLLDRIRGWPAPRRLTLALRILETLEATTGDRPAEEGARRGWPVEKALGLLRDDREPPDDEECRRIVEEARWDRYGL